MCAGQRPVTDTVTVGSRYRPKRSILPIFRRTPCRPRPARPRPPGMVAWHFVIPFEIASAMIRRAADRQGRCVAQSRNILRRWDQRAERRRVMHCARTGSPLVGYVSACRWMALRCTSIRTDGISAKYARPGTRRDDDPDRSLRRRAVPFHAAPMTIPMAASSPSFA